MSRAGEGRRAEVSEQPGAAEESDCAGTAGRVQDRPGRIGWVTSVLRMDGEGLMEGGVGGLGGGVAFCLQSG